MRIEWADHPGEIDRTCPVCASAGPKRVRLAVDEERAGAARRLLLDCAACGSAFYDELSRPSYESAALGAGFLKYYVELGAGLDTMIEPLCRIDPVRVRTYLEIGCGFGLSLDFARFAFAWLVSGMDPSPLAAAGRDLLDLDIASEYLSERTDFGRRFDLVLCSEVIEHLPEPAGLVRLMARTLEDDGALIVTTPNVRALRREAPFGLALSILAPGCHLILYTAASLASILRQNGFSHVQVWEHANSLHALAMHRPLPPPRAAVVDRGTYRRYLAARAAALPPDSPVAVGLSYRLYKELVNAGSFREAEQVFASLRDCFARLYRIDLDQPAALTFQAEPGVDFEEFARSHAFNLCCTLYFRGTCAFVDRRDYPRAIEYFRAAFRAGVAIAAQLAAVGTADGETENLICQARIHTLYGLVATDPAAAVAEFLEIGAPPPTRSTGDHSWRLPAPLVGATRRDLLLRLFEAGAYHEAKPLLPGLLAGLPPGSRLPARLDSSLDALAELCRDAAAGKRRGGAVPAALRAHHRLRLGAALGHLSRSPGSDLSGLRLWTASARFVLAVLSGRLHGPRERP